MTQRKDQRFSVGGFRSRGVVRTRGYIPTTSTEASVKVPTRTRGAARARGGPAIQMKPWQELKPEELEGLLEELRETQDGFPITFVVENPQATQVRNFLEQLHKLLGADDVLWVIGEGTYHEVIPEALRGLITESAYLNTKEQMVVVNSLVPDFIFIADENTEKLKKRLKKWERRVWAVILACPDDFTPSALNDLALGIPGEDGNCWRRCWSRE